MSIENIVVDSLATGVGKFETPTTGKRKYKVDIMRRPSIPNNTKYCDLDLCMNEMKEHIQNHNNRHFAKITEIQ